MQATLGSTPRQGIVAGKTNLPEETELYFEIRETGNPEVQATSQPCIVGPDGRFAATADFEFPIKTGNYEFQPRIDTYPMALVKLTGERGQSAWFTAPSFRPKIMPVRGPLTDAQLAQVKKCALEVLGELDAEKSNLPKPLPAGFSPVQRYSSVWQSKVMAIRSPPGTRGLTMKSSSKMQLADAL